MVQLLLVVMAIGLAAVAATVGVSYLSPDRPAQATVRSQVSIGFRSFESAFQAYRVSNRADPDSIADLFPYLATGAPVSPQGMTWSYGVSGGRRYFCLSGSLSAQAQGQLVKALRFPTATGIPDLSVTSACADAAGPTPGAGPVAVTHFVS